MALARIEQSELAEDAARETEVLALLVRGLSDGRIAGELYISPKTASVHVASIKGKLGASSRVEIVTNAVRMGLVTIPDEVAT
jgi:DNA-binding NarL/FixJ family response regulator